MTWIFPREHGAYGQLAFPIAAALGSGSPRLASWLLVIAFVAAFIAHEPVLVLIGQRGPRARRERRADAIRTLATAAAVAIVCAAVAVPLMAAPWQWTILVPAAFAAAAIPMIVQRTQKTTWGELYVALTLASCALPVGVAAGVPALAAATCWFVLTLGFWAATLAVRGTIARQRGQPSLGLRAAAGTVAIVSPLLTAGVAAAAGLDARLWVAAVPLALPALLVAAAGPSARRLRVLGWSLIAASAAAAIALAVLNHAAQNC